MNDPLDDLSYLDNSIQDNNDQVKIREHKLIIFLLCFFFYIIYFVLIHYHKLICLKIKKCFQKKNIKKKENISFV